MADTVMSGEQPLLLPLPPGTLQDPAPQVIVLTPHTRVFTILRQSGTENMFGTMKRLKDNQCLTQKGLQHSKTSKHREHVCNYSDTQGSFPNYDN